MRKWTVSTNSYYNFGHYLLQEAPWYVYVAIWVNLSILFRFVKLLTFNSRLTSWYFYKVAVNIHRELSKYEKITLVPVLWEDLVKEQPLLMKKAVAQSIKYSGERVDEPNFNWNEYNNKKREFSAIEIMRENSLMAE